MPVSDDSVATYAEVISDDTAVSPLDELANKNYLDELEDTLGVSHKRIRQVVNAAIGKMRKALSKKETSSQALVPMHS